MADKKLTDLEKLIALSLIFELQKRGKISSEEFEKVCESQKDLLSKNNVSFSHFFDN